MAGCHRLVAFLWPQLAGNYHEEVRTIIAKGTVVAGRPGACSGSIST